MKPFSSLFLVLALGSLFGGCGSNGGGAAGSGQVSLVLTDAASDDLAQFEVDVGKVVFRKAGGMQVSVLPRATRVDFVELESLAELVAAGDLEAGVYSGLTMTLDFSDARVVIADQSAPATVVDRSGNPITGTLNVSVEFPDVGGPRVGVSRRHLFVLDLDLAQSVSVDRAANRVTFTPVLNAEIDPGQPKPITTLGVLESVAVDAGTFGVERRGHDGRELSSFTVRVTPATVFQIDGVPSLGAASLGALAGRDGERVFVQGTLSRESGVLDAETVEAGDGVPGNVASSGAPSNRADQVVGHVIARSSGAGGDTVLTVLGRSFDAGSGERRWNTQFSAPVSLAGTRVVRRGSAEALSANTINVGQLVWIFGDLNGTTITATAGIARLLRTSIFGVVNGDPGNDVLTLDVSRFDLRAVSQFDFDVDSVTEANPEAFTVDVTGLSTDGIDDGSRVRVSGWINPVGIVGDANARAAVIVDRGTRTKVLLCQWQPPTTAAFVANQGSPNELTLDVADADIRAVFDGFNPVALNVTPLPTLRALEATGCYRVVGSEDHIDVFANFVAFREAVLARASSHAVFRVSALGTFDAATQAFSALTATVVFGDDD